MDGEGYDGGITAGSVIPHEKRPSDIILERDAFEYAVIHFRNSEEAFHDALKSAIQAYLFEANSSIDKSGGET